jgi:hypothetical protein
MAETSTPVKGRNNFLSSRQATGESLLFLLSTGVDAEMDGRAKRLGEKDLRHALRRLATDTVVVSGEIGIYSSQSKNRYSSTVNFW